MKAILFFSLALCLSFSNSSWAQQQAPSVFPDLDACGIQFQQSGFISLKQQVQATRFAQAKIAGTNVRLISTYNAKGLSGAFVSTDSTYYTYSGNRGGSVTITPECDTMISYVWNGITSKWIPDSKSITTYNAQNMPMTRLQLSWNATTSSYDNSFNTTYSYDASGNRSEILSKSWDPGSSTWENLQRSTLYTFDASGNTLSFVFQNWQASNSTWQNSTRYTFTYDANSFPNHSLIEYWDMTATNWRNFSQKTIVYNTGGMLVSQEEQTWATSTSTWLNSQAYYNYYTASNHLMAAAYRHGDGTGLAWINVDSLNYTARNAAELPLTEKDFSWDGTFWQPSKMVSYTYDATGLNVNQKVYEIWNGTSFDNNNRSLYSYNAGGLLTATHTESYAAGAWDIADSDLSSRYRYGASVSVPAAPQSNFEVVLSPNPVTTQLHITIPAPGAGNRQIFIYDMLGRLVFQTEMPGYLQKTTLATQGFPYGNYLLKVTGSEGSQVQRFSVCP